MKPATEKLLIEKIRQLPPQRLAEVEDFVDFLRSRDDRQAAAQRLTNNLTKLDALNLPAFSEQAINDEVQAARQVRRSRQG